MFLWLFRPRGIVWIMFQAFFNFVEIFSEKWGGQKFSWGDFSKNLQMGGIPPSPHFSAKGKTLPKYISNNTRIGALVCFVQGCGGQNCATFTCKISILQKNWYRIYNWTPWSASLIQKKPFEHLYIPSPVRFLNLISDRLII